MKRALFICSRNRLRSPTAEQVFASWQDVETDSAGERQPPVMRVAANVAGPVQAVKDTST